MNKIAIYGAGGLGREIAMLLRHINSITPVWEIIGFFDDGIPDGSLIDGYKVLGDLQAANNYPEPLAFTLAIADGASKKRIAAALTNSNIYYPVLIHPNVICGDIHAGEGAIITAGNILTVNVSLGKHVLLNLACTTGHDAIIDAYSSVMPGTNISGEVKIGEGTYIGTGVKIINRVRIGRFSKIGAGAVVTRDIPDLCTAVGIPAKPVKFNQ